MRTQENRNTTTENGTLNEQEENFCQLLVNASAPFAGNPRKCYASIYHVEEDAVAMAKAKKLLVRDDIKARLNELREVNEFTAENLKNRVAAGVLKIAEECSVAEYRDRRGVKQSPAALRSVAVNAYKTLNEMYGLREAIQQDVNIKSNGTGGIVFNVIQPSAENTEEPEL